MNDLFAGSNYRNTVQTGPAEFNLYEDAGVLYIYCDSGTDPNTPTKNAINKRTGLRMDPYTMDKIATHWLNHRDIRALNKTIRGSVKVQVELDAGAVIVLECPDNVDVKVELI